MKGDAELLAVYVDGVTELTTDERRRVEALLARERSLRGDADGLRGVLAELRELPREGGEPDWAALERSIHDAVGTDVPRPWYARLRWRWIVPTLALATTAAAVILVTRASDGRGASTPPPAPAPAIARTPPPAPAADTVPLWLDGRAVEVELDASHELLDEWALDALDDAGAAGLLPASDLQWVDALDDRALELAEQWLADPARPGGPT